MGQDASVLVVDDDKGIRDVIATVLEDDGYNVATASDGAEALRKVGEHEPDAIILDAMMPRMTGWEFLALWRTRPTADRAPVLVVSAVSDELIALERGRVLIRGTADVVLNDDRVIESYLGGSEEAVRRSGGLK